MMGLTLTQLRRQHRSMVHEGFYGLTAKPDGSIMSPAYIVVLSKKDVPFDQDGFVRVAWYDTNTMMPNEVGALEAFRFIVDDTVDAPVFIRSVDEYKLYPATQTSK